MKLKKSLLLSTVILSSLGISKKVHAFTSNYADKSVNQIVSFASDLANRGVGVDIDGSYGTQCVDLSNWITTKYFGKWLSGNAIDLLNSAKNQGLTVIYARSGELPKAGDIYVSDTRYLYGHPYGHTGLVIKNLSGMTFKTVEQNIDGNANNLSVGGPARYTIRHLKKDYIVGWIRPPYTSDNNSEEVPDQSNSLSEQPMKNPMDNSAGKASGVFFVSASRLNVRDKPSLSGNIVAAYTSGMSFTFNGTIDAEGYRWARYVGYSGAIRYTAIGQVSNGQFIPIFGTVK